MGTRGAVAWITGKGTWRGLYNHWDSYPTVLGKEVFEKISELGMEKTLAELKKYGDWREVMTGGLCQFCGKKAGQPHSYSVNSSPEYYNPTEKANVERTGYPDPEAINHKHGSGKQDQFDPRKEPLYIEWVYLLNPANNSIEVWTFVKAAEKNPALVSTGKIGEAGYTHVKLAEWSMSHAPDYKRLEKGADLKRLAPEFRKAETI
jgi:hypothetical protein